MTTAECMFKGLEPFIPSIDLVGANSRQVSMFSNSLHVRYVYNDKNLCFTIAWNKAGFSVNGLRFEHAAQIGCYIYDKLNEKD